MLKNQKGFGYLEVILLLAAILIIVLISFKVFSNSKEPASSTVSTNLSTERKPDSVKPTPYGVSATGPGWTGGELSIKVGEVVVNPQVEKGEPKAGFEYRQIFFTVNNIGSKDDVSIYDGLLYYQDSTGKKYKPATVGPAISAEPVLVVGNHNNGFFRVDLSPGQTSSMHYTVYQVPEGDKGRIIWYSDPKGGDNNILGILELN